MGMLGLMVRGRELKVFELNCYFPLELLSLALIELPHLLLFLVHPPVVDVLLLYLRDVENRSDLA